MTDIAGDANEMASWAQAYFAARSAERVSPGGIMWSPGLSGVLAGVS